MTINLLHETTIRVHILFKVWISTLDGLLIQYHNTLTLILFPSTVLLGLIRAEAIQNWVFLFLLFSTSIYVNWRSAYSSSQVHDDPSKLSFLQKIIYSQQKPNNSIRASSNIGIFLYILRINTSTQFGKSVKPQTNLEPT